MKTLLIGLLLLIAVPQIAYKSLRSYLSFTGCQPAEITSVKYDPYMGYIGEVKVNGKNLYLTFISDDKINKNYPTEKMAFQKFIKLKKPIQITAKFNPNFWAVNEVDISNC